MNIDELLDQLGRTPAVTLDHSEVPPALMPDGFFETMIRRVLDNSPITRHVAARELLRHPRSE
jgi:hypothetical protein